MIHLLCVAGDDETTLDTEEPVKKPPRPLLAELAELAPGPSELLLTSFDVRKVGGILSLQFASSLISRDDSSGLEISDVLRANRSGVGPGIEFIASPVTAHVTRVHKALNENNKN